ncbi:MAG TPA: M50 family metallopeptidase, partial [Solirubrobacteraceae bacterium]
IVATGSVGAIEKNKPAAGRLRAGDKIVAVDGVTVSSPAAAMKHINSHRCAGTLAEGCRGATPVAMTVRRGGRDVAIAIYPVYNREAGRMIIGFGFAVAAKQFGVFSAAGAARGEMWHATTQTLTGFGRALTESKVRHQVSSIIGITQVGHETVAAGAGYGLVFLGFLSLILAVINLFPFLPLDGGHVLWSVAEKVRGKRISLLAMYRFSSVGIVLLLFLVVNGVSNDISRLAG